MKAIWAEELRDVLAAAMSRAGIVLPEDRSQRNFVVDKFTVALIEAGFRTAQKERVRAYTAEELEELEHE
jgi:hypothetical protein